MKATGNTSKYSGMLPNPGKAAQMIIVDGKRIIDSIENTKNLTDEEYSQLIFVCYALIHVLIDRRAILSLSGAERIEYTDKLNARLLYYCSNIMNISQDNANEYIIHNKDLYFSKLELYSALLTPLKGQSFKGTLFWEFGRLVEQLSSSKISQPEALIAGTSIGINLLDTVANEESAGTQPKTRKLWRKALVITLAIGIVVGSAYLYQHYRAPNEQDRLSFMYECQDYTANKIFKGTSGDHNTAMAVCTCLWPNLVGKYGSIGAIKQKLYINDKSFSVSDAEVNKIGLSCLKSYHDRE